MGSSMEFRQYDVVRIMAFSAGPAGLNDESNLRQPEVGDIATIIELYSSPTGYELECSDANGITQWLMSFRPEDVVLELRR